MSTNCFILLSNSPLFGYYFSVLLDFYTNKALEQLRKGNIFCQYSTSCMCCFFSSCLKLQSRAALDNSFGFSNYRISYSKLLYLVWCQNITEVLIRNVLLKYFNDFLRAGAESPVSECWVTDMTLLAEWGLGLVL